MYYAQFRTQIEDHREKREGVPAFHYRWFMMNAESYHNALRAFSFLIPFLQDAENLGWRLMKITEEHPGEDTVFSPVPPNLKEYKPCFYDAAHDYDYMIIEGTRLLGLKDDGKSSAYGAYVRNKNTGAMSYACANGTFFTHGQILSALDKIHKRAPGYDPTDSYVWHPILFPYTQDAEEPQINFAYYLASEPILSFPMQFWGHESYDKQIKWIAEQEGMM